MLSSAGWNTCYPTSQAPHLSQLTLSPPWHYEPHKHNPCSYAHAHTHTHTHTHTRTHTAGRLLVSRIGCWWPGEQTCQNCVPEEDGVCFSVQPQLVVTNQKVRLTGVTWEDKDKTPRDGTNTDRVSRFSWLKMSSTSLTVPAGLSSLYRTGGPLIWGFSLLEQ